MPLNESGWPVGFSDGAAQAGAHVCQIFSTDDERNDALVQFILDGLRVQDRVACFSEKADPNRLREFFGENGFSYDQCVRSEAFTLSGTAEAYFENDAFDPDRMIDLLRRFHREAMDKRFAGARVIGEMTPVVQDLPGGDRLMEYESRVSLLLRDHPVSAVCQYDANAFDGATIMDILKVHPLMVVRGAVVRNPFFITPEEFLK